MTDQLFIRISELEELANTGRLPAPVSLCDVVEPLSDYVPYAPPHNPDPALYDVGYEKAGGSYEFTIVPKPISEFVEVLKGRLAVAIDARALEGVEVSGVRYRGTDQEVRGARLLAEEDLPCVYYKNNGEVLRLSHDEILQVAFALEELQGKLVSVRTNLFSDLDFSWSQEHALGLFQRGLLL